MIDTTKATRREVTLPAATLVAMLASARAAGEDALREQGRIAGRLLAERLTAPHDAASVRALPVEQFWKRVSDTFSSRGWGTLSHADAAPGVGELRAGDWIEADRAGSGGRCAFTAGALQGLLQEVSGAPLEVEEHECRAAGSAACRFRFGSRAALDALRVSAAAISAR